LDNKIDIIHTLIEMVRSEVKPAIGCTEPVTIAFAVATARKYIKGEIKMVKVKTSLNIYKNGKSVIIPGTNECGPELAAALGFVAGDAEDDLCVFKNVHEASLLEAKTMIKENKVFVEPLQGCHGIYVEVELKGENNVRVVLNNCHTHIESIEVDGKYVFEDIINEANDSSKELLKSLTFKEIRKLTEEAHFDDISFVLEGIPMNMKAAEEGLNKTSGFNMGAGLQKLQQSTGGTCDSSMKARILTAAGADFRMAGGTLPIMTSGGSGNQGLCVILPIAVIGESTGCSQDKIARALFFAHSINIFVKSYIGKLSSLCGCAIAAGVGASVGITWMLGGTDEQIAGAADNMLANLTGMICDGAKESCSMKLSTSAGEAVLSAYLAYTDIIVPKNTGIISGSVEQTIKSVETLCKDGLKETEEVLVQILYENTKKIV
jgi:L-cysteine desulfidase